MKINKELEKYIKDKILPRYNDNDKWAWNRSCYVCYR